MSGGVPNYGIARDFPLLWKMAKEHDFAEKLGGSTSQLHQEVDAALREVWDARRYLSEESSRLPPGGPR